MFTRPDTENAKGGEVNPSAHIIDRLSIAQNYAETNVDLWAQWKREIVLSKLLCLQKLMECEDRRQAGKIN